MLKATLIKITAFLLSPFYGTAPVQAEIKPTITQNTISAADAEQKARLLVIDFMNPASKPSMTLNEYIDTLEIHAKHIKQQDWQDFMATLREMRRTNASQKGWMMVVVKFAQHQAFLQKIAHEAFGKLDTAAVTAKIQRIIAKG